MTSLLLLGEKGEVLSPSNETASACRCQGAVLQGHGHEHLVTTTAWEAKSPTAPALQGAGGSSMEGAWDAPVCTAGEGGAALCCMCHC